VLVYNKKGNDDLIALKVLFTRPQFVINVMFVCLF
jgi:hypothetical protein